jgi:hypothetical protein
MGISLAVSLHANPLPGGRPPVGRPGIKPALAGLRLPGADPAFRRQPQCARYGRDRRCQDLRGIRFVCSESVTRLSSPPGAAGQPSAPAGCPKTTCRRCPFLGRRCNAVEMSVTAETAWYGVDMPRSHALLTIPIYRLGWPDHRLRLNDQRGGSGRMGSAEQDRIMVDRLYLAWQRHGPGRVTQRGLVRLGSQGGG